MPRKKTSPNVIAKKSKISRARKPNNSNKIQVNRDERSSHFVVDLKIEHENSLQEDIASLAPSKGFQRTFQKSKNAFVFLKKRKKKEVVIKEKEIDKMFALVNSSVSAVIFGKEGEKISDDSERVKKEKKEELNLDAIQMQSEQKKKVKIRELAIFGIGKLFFKLCYSVGWVLLFAVRFVFFALVRITNIVFPKRTKIAEAVREISAVILSNLRFNKKQKVDAIESKKTEENLLLIREKKCEKKLKLNEKLAVNKKIILSFFTKKKKDKIAPVDSELEKNIPDTFPKTKLGLLRPAFSFLVVVFLLILPFKFFDYYQSLNISELKGRVLGASENAVSNLFLASDSISNLDFAGAKNNFSKAGESFLDAKDQVNEINSVFLKIAKYVPNDEVKMASQSENILNVGRIISELGENISLAFDSLFENKAKENNVGMLRDFSENGNKAVRNIKELNYELNRIDIEVLPEEYQEKFLQLKILVNDLDEGLSDFTEIMTNLAEFLGANEDKRYLFVFQNNTEKRASGGFIGSYALIDLSEAKLKNIEVPAGGSYDTEGGLTEFVRSPEPLHLVDPLWHFWDANWWPDWPTSAQKLMWFYEKSNGPTVDGVISLTPSVIEKLLEIVGPIDMSEGYGVVIDKDNFWITVQSISEEKLSPEQIANNVKHEPKRIIGDLVNEIFNRLKNNLNRDSMIGLIKVIEASLQEKQILLYFTDSEIQKTIESYGWDGAMIDTSWDYLSVVNTNIAGGKSDKKIKEEINHLVEITDDGRIIDTLKIKRSHLAERGEPYVGVRNVNWLRIYVPRGSRLIEARGFKTPDASYFKEPQVDWEVDIQVYRAETSAIEDVESGTKVYNELDKTVFANWSMVDPGETTEIFIKYELPFKLEKEPVDKTVMDQIRGLINKEQEFLYPYSLYVQKQAGSLGSEFSSSLKISNKMQLVQKYPQELNILNDGWYERNDLNTDKYWAVLISKE